jgi:L-asparaginase
MARLPRVGIIPSGGTIDSVGRDRLDVAWYAEGGQRLADSELLTRVPELASIAEVQEIPFRRLPSHALVASDWLDLLRIVQSALDDPAFDGVVVTHGTNTLEETAYFLHLTVKSDKPVVLVGAMRPASAISADGYLNLLNATRVAAARQSRGHGVLVGLNDTILSARDVTKNSTYRVNAFESRDLGPLGYADADGRVLYYHRSLRRHSTDSEFDVRALTALPRVDIVVSYVGSDGALISAAASAGANGIVMAGSGAGRPTPSEDAALDEAYNRHGTLICMASRIGSGRVVRSPGLARRNFVAADNLPPWKARVLLALALTRTRNSDEIQGMFDAY